MSVPSWHEESIGTGHDRAAFDCGQPALNEFLRRYARQSHDLGGAKTFVAVEDGNTSRILGFYTVSPGSLLYARTPATVRRGLGRHDPGSEWRRRHRAGRHRAGGDGVQVLPAAPAAEGEEGDDDHQDAGNGGDEKGGHRFRSRRQPSVA